MLNIVFAAVVGGIVGIFATGMLAVAPLHEALRVAKETRDRLRLELERERAEHEATKILLAAVSVDDILGVEWDDDVIETMDDVIETMDDVIETMDDVIETEEEAA